MERGIVEFHGPDQPGQVVVGGGAVHHVHPHPGETVGDHAAGEGLGGAGPLVTSFLPPHQTLLRLITCSEMIDRLAHGIVRIIAHSIIICTFD